MSSQPNQSRLYGRQGVNSRIVRDQSEARGPSVCQRWEFGFLYLQN